MTLDLTARYAKAESLLSHNLKKLIHTPRVVPIWVRNTDRFSYRRSTAAGTEFVLVDPEKKTKSPAFDHERMAKALSGFLKEPVQANALPFFWIEFINDGIRVTVKENKLDVSLKTYEIKVVGPSIGETTSPDGRWAVGFSGLNLYIRDTTTDEKRELTSDAAEAYTYGRSPDASAVRVMQENLGFTLPPAILWSQDSKRFVTFRLDQRNCQLMHLVRSSPPDGGRPKPMTYRYSLLGDEQLGTAEYFVFEAATGKAMQAKCKPVLMPYVSSILLGFVWWNEEGTKVYWIAGDRGDRTVGLYELEVASGNVAMLLEETSKTNVLLGPQHSDRNVRVLASGEVLWWSERSGWGHLYLYGKNGKITTVTGGDWLVRKIVSVDEKKRRVVFTAGGRERGADIYLQELYSVSLDAGEITTVTADKLDHDTFASKSGGFFVDVMSRVDVPAVSVVRDATGAVVMELEKADAAALFAAGFKPPERVVVKSADGVTDIYCAIYKPFDFDPAQKYPVLDEIYPGPQISCAPLRFPQSGGIMTGERSGTIFAALGFVVVVVDGRGTALRHKAFQDHARLVGDSQYVDDHVAAIKQLAKTRPWMDLERVGIYGHSGGGYASTRSLLQAPDFYKVAVSSAGDHDDRTYHSWWGEKFYGRTGEFDFDAHANVALVENLKGKLFLAHGEMDDNVTPHLTMRLVDALIKANKDFDLLIVPNADHFMAVNAAYWVRRRWDYFVQHLMGETPPAYRIAEIPFDAEMLASMGG
jgi:dipeptidyl aminopeptidase/acylaminoacyl peptidase